MRSFFTKGRSPAPPAELHEALIKFYTPQRKEFFGGAYKSDFSHSHRKSIMMRLKDNASQKHELVLKALGRIRNNNEVDASSIHAFWLLNGVSIRASKAVLKQLAQTFGNEIERIDFANIATSEERHLEADKAFRDKGQENCEVDDRRFDCVSPPDYDTASKALDLMRVRDLWKRGIKGNGVVVAVLDSGINPKHPDLRMWRAGAGNEPCIGRNFEDSEFVPENAKHGTACAGLIGGCGALGHASGAAPNAEIMDMRAYSSSIRIWKGIEFAIEHGAHILNMSMHVFVPSLNLSYEEYITAWNREAEYWREACENILSLGILHSQAVGNFPEKAFKPFPERWRIPYNVVIPAVCPPPRLHPVQEKLKKGGVSSAISCGNFDLTTWRIAENKSSIGPAVWETPNYYDYTYFCDGCDGIIRPDICAPGQGSVSCSASYGEGSQCPYVSLGGSSAAAAHLSGCMALLVEACIKSGNPVSPPRILEAIETAPTFLGVEEGGKNNKYGAGMVNVLAAFEYGEQKGWWNWGRS